MKHKHSTMMNGMGKDCLGLVVLGLCGLFAGCSGIQMDVFPWGEVELNTPLDAGTVTITSVGSGGGFWSGPVENGSFIGRVPAWKFWGAPKDVIVAATGGQAAGKSFTGTLKAYVPAYDPAIPVRVNVISTIIAAYMDVRQVSCQAAHDEVFDFLKIPRDNPLTAEGHLPNNAAFFDPERFMAQAEAAGGVEAYIQDLVQNHVGTNEVQSFSSLQGPMAGGAASEIGSFLLEEIVGGIWDGIVAYDTDKSMGWVLSSYGFGDEGSEQFAEIDHALEEMDGKLDVIQNELVAITGQLDALLAAVNLSRDQIIQQISGYNITDPQNVINNQYDNLSTTFPHGDSTAHTGAGYQKAHDFAVSITSSALYDLDQQLYNLNSGIIGSSVGTVGFLDACTNVLIDQANSGADVLECYKVLENSFSELLSVEGKGLVLTVEALHLLNNDINSAQKDYTGTATQFLAKFQGYLDAQTAKFMSCVDRLVVSRINVRTDIANPPQFLPDNAASIYERADFLVSQITKAQPAGLVVRVIGTSAQVMDMYSSGFYIRETAVDTVCPQSGAGSTTSTYTDYLLNPVSVNGNTSNSYPAALPDYSKKGYLEWALVGTTNQFQVQKNIVVVKLVLSDTVLSVQTYTDADTCDSGAGTTHEMSWTVEPGLQGPTAGSPTDLLRTYDSQFTVAPTGTQYASLLFFHRQLPGAWSTNQQWNSKQGGNQLGNLFDPSTMSATSLTTIRDYDTFEHCTDAGGAPSCLWYADFSFEVTATQGMTFAPHSPVDTCTLTANPHGKIGLALSAKLNSSQLQQWVMFGGGSTTAAYKCEGAVSGSPLTQPPSAEIPSAACFVPPTPTAELILAQKVTGAGTWVNGQQPGSVQAGGHVQYSSLEVYPSN